MKPIETASVIMAVICLAAGLLSVAAALFDFDWFFNSPNARSLTGRMPRRWARAFYFIIGLAIIAMGVTVVI